MTDPNIILGSEAARRKGCTAQCIYNALDKGTLTEHRQGRHRFVVLDEKWEAYEVQETGGRLHKRYQEAHSYDIQDDS